jgi:hypothetical protein
LGQNGLDTPKTDCKNSARSIRSQSGCGAPLDLRGVPGLEAEILPFRALKARPKRFFVFAVGHFAGDFRLCR